MSPKLRSVLARVVLIGGTALLGTYIAKSAPHDQSIAVRLGDREVTRIQAVVTKWGDDEPTAGFSQDFSAEAPAPRVVRHAFSAPNGTYIVVITREERATPEPEAAPESNTAAPDVAAKAGPKLIETTFERRVSLTGGEVIVSPD